MDMPTRKTFIQWARALTGRVDVRFHVDGPRAKTIHNKLIEHSIATKLDYNDAPLNLNFPPDWLWRYGDQDRLEREMSFTFFEQAIKDTIKRYIPEHFHPDDDQMEVIFPGDVSITNPPKDNEPLARKSNDASSDSKDKDSSSSSEDEDEDEDEEDEEEYAENEGPNFVCPDCQADIDIYCHVVTKVTVTRHYTSDDIEFTWEDGERSASVNDEYNDYEDVDEETYETCLHCQKCGHEFDESDINLDSWSW